MSETFQPVLACIGLTNSVHEYCRFAIMIIAINDAMSWNQRLCNRMTRLLDPIPVNQALRGRSVAQTSTGRRHPAVLVATLPNSEFLIPNSQFLISLHPVI